MKDFDKYSSRGAYHWDWYRQNKFGYRDKVTRILSYLPNRGVVLDGGCGDGVLSCCVHNKGLDVVGIDINECAIQIAREKASAHCADRPPEFKVSSIFDVENDCYDYCVCCDVIEHVEDCQGIINKIINCAKLECVITTPDAAYYSPGNYDFRLYSVDELAGMLQQFKPSIQSIEGTIYVRIKRSSL